MVRFYERKLHLLFGSQNYILCAKRGKELFEHTMKVLSVRATTGKGFNRH